jgi:hypothetical protein
MAGSPSALNAHRRTATATGSKQRIEPPLADSEHSFTSLSSRYISFLSYVQELEARLIQMEGLLTQVGAGATRPDTSSVPPPPHKQQQPATSVSPPSQQRPASNGISANKETTSYLVDPNVKQEPPEPDHFGQLAPDQNGHLRWIGGSSAMTLVDAFRNISNRSAKSLQKSDTMQERCHRAEAKTAAHNLYFPPILQSDVRALPGPEQAEFPPRDLADKLVSFIEQQ